MKINLVYDARQEDTQKLQQMDPGIDKMEASLKALDQGFDIKKGSSGFLVGTSTIDIRAWKKITASRSLRFVSDFCKQNMRDIEIC